MPLVHWDTAGTAIVELTIPVKPGENRKKTLLGCFVKKDANVKPIVKNHIDPSADRNKYTRSDYLFYSPVSDFQGRVSKAVISYEEISKKLIGKRNKLKTKEYTVKEPLVITCDGHFFLCCDQELKSDFLEQHSKEVRIDQTLDLTKKFCGLTKEDNMNFLKVISFNMQQSQNHDRLYEFVNDTQLAFNKLLETGPLLLDDNKTVVGCYRKTTEGNKTLEIDIFGKQDDKVRRQEEKLIRFIKVKTTLVVLGVQLAGASVLYRYWTNPEGLDVLLPFRNFGLQLFGFFAGSVVFVLKVPSISSLKQLWQSYNDGELEKELKKAFNEMEDLKKLSQGKEIDVEVTIDEEEYREVLLDLILLEVTGKSMKNTRSHRRHSAPAVCPERDVPEESDKLMDVTQTEKGAGPPVTELEKRPESKMEHQEKVSYLYDQLRLEVIRHLDEYIKSGRGTLGELKERLHGSLSKLKEKEREDIDIVSKLIQALEDPLAVIGVTNVKLLKLLSGTLGLRELKQNVEKYEADYPRKVPLLPADFFTINPEGGTLDMPRIGIRLDIPPHTVTQATYVMYQNNTTETLPLTSPAGKDETVVSYIVELGPSTVQLNEPIFVSMMHSGPGKGFGYETIVKAYDQDSKTWEEPEVLDCRQENISTHCRRDYVRVQISKLTILAVVTRLITDRFQVTPKGCVVRSSVCHDVTVEFPEGAVDKSMEGTMKLLPMPNNIYSLYNVYACPMLYMKGFENVELLKSATIKMLNPCPTGCSADQAKLVRLKNDKWQGVEDPKIEVRDTYITFQIQHFCWLWLIIPVAVAPLYKLYKYLRTPPQAAYIAASRNNQQPALQMKLHCLPNHKQEEVWGADKVLNASTVDELRPGETALTKIEGCYETNEEIYLKFLENQESFSKVLNLRRKQENTGAKQQSVLLVFYKKENEDSPLCKFSIQEDKLDPYYNDTKRNDGCQESAFVLTQLGREEKAEEQMHMPRECLKKVNTTPQNHLPRFPKSTSQEGDAVGNIGTERDDVFGKYDNFALDYRHRVYFANMEEMMGLKYSVGAIVALNVSNVPESGATCFRIGTKYVITCKHVVDDIKSKGITMSNCYVDFNYKEEGQPSFRVDFAPNPELVSSAELDYAILELYSDGGESFPPSVTELGFNIAPSNRQLQGGECLTLIGHPRGPKKQIDVSCPIKHQKDIQEYLNKPHLVYLVQNAYNNPDCATYDVSTFLEGSSGSPGLSLDKKLLMVLHSGGIHEFEGTNKRHVLEDGTLMSSVVDDVMKKIKSGVIQNLNLDEIFGGSTSLTFDHFPEPMEVDQVPGS